MHEEVNCVATTATLFCLFYLPFLSFIHEKANCIVILWTGSPHSLGSCLFRGLWATCLPHKGGRIPLSALPKDTTSELAGLFSRTSHKCRAPSRKAKMPFFKVFWYDSTRGMNPRSTDCEADALTTTPSRRLTTNSATHVESLQQHFNYKPQVESHQQHLAVYMNRHLH